jgi:hypothetical protein
MQRNNEICSSTPVPSRVLQAFIRRACCSFSWLSYLVVIVSHTVSLDRSGVCRDRQSFEHFTRGEPVPSRTAILAAVLAVEPSQTCQVAGRRYWDAA